MRKINTKKKYHAKRNEEGENAMHNIMKSRMLKTRKIFKKNIEDACDIVAARRALKEDSFIPLSCLIEELGINNINTN